MINARIDAIGEEVGMRVKWVGTGGGSDGNLFASGLLTAIPGLLFNRFLKHGFIHVVAPHNATAGINGSAKS